MQPNIWESRMNEEWADQPQSGTSPLLRPHDQEVQKNRVWIFNYTGDSMTHRQFQIQVGLKPPVQSSVSHK